MSVAVWEVTAGATGATGEAVGWTGAGAAVEGAGVGAVVASAEHEIEVI